ncbi:MAG TPA: orotate phosphoribosyltransferase [Acidimicrobiales bacterium]|nr:orotate phosphoribosyltransferase [Acidimicrobiales bacterium]
MTSVLARRLLETCQLRGQFVLRSGVTSAEYFDKYLFESDPALLLDVASAMIDLLEPCDVLAGMEMGGIPLVTVLSQVSGLPAVFVRKAAKDYGTRKAVEGVAVRGLRVVAVEDVVTTAGALVAGCQELRAAGAIVDIAICAIDRGQGGGAALAVHGVELRSAVERSELDGIQGRV